MRRPALLAICAACFAARVCFAADAVTCSPWFNVATLQPGVYSAAATSDGNYAYVAGGYSTASSAAVTRFSRYDRSTGSWTALAPMPDAVFGASAAYSAVTKKIYVFGGRFTTPPNAISNATRTYDIATNTWSAGLPMPAPRSLMAIGERFGEIFLAGGYSGAAVNTAGNQVWEYDAVANNWITTRQAMPVAMGDAGFGLVNGHLYVAGGRNDIFTPGTAGLYDYDITLDRWRQRANVPIPIDLPGCAVIEGQLALFGGESSGYNANTYFYNPDTDSWSSGPALVEARTRVAGTTIQDELFAYGGYNGSASGATEATEGFSCRACAWSSQPAFPNNIRANGTAGLRSNVYSFGGLTRANSSSPETQVRWAYKFDGTNWTQLPDLPQAVYGAAVACSEEECYIINGALATPTLYTLSNKWWVYDPVLTSYVERSGATDGTAFAAAVALNGKVYRIGGYIQCGASCWALTDEVLVFDPVTVTWTTLAPYPLHAAGISVFTLGGYIYGVGGQIATTTGGAIDTSKAFRYDPLTNTWDDAAIADLPYTSSFAATGAYHGSGIIAGGYAGRTDASLNAITSLALRWDAESNTWQYVPFYMPTARAETNGAVASFGFYVIGGRYADDNSSHETARLACPAPCQQTVLYQDFDTTAVPNLPSDWIGTSFYGGASWVTSNNLAYSPPNDAFIDDVRHGNAPSTDAMLQTYVHIPAGSARLTFHNSYGLAYAYAGGVLELSSAGIAGGDFTDVTDPATGARFENGGYSASILAGPLSGRRAWTGSSGSLPYFTSTVDLGATLAGRAVSFRFRMGADLSQNHTYSGWRVDDVTITGPCFDLSQVLTPAIVRFQRSAGVSVVTFDGDDTQTYKLERKLTLTDPSWQAIAQSIDRAAEAEIITRLGDSTAADKSRAFYRVRVVIP